MTGKPTVGTKIEDVPTPALVIDLEALDHNFSMVSKMYTIKQETGLGHSRQRLILSKR